jgi:alkylation response protein AidB-like acyl-CoA dehydrogenase
MNFTHTEDRRMLADSLDRYIAKRYPIETRHAITKSASGMSQEHWRELAELGAVGALFDESVGGYGGAAFDIAVVFETIGRGLVAEPFLPVLLAGSVLAQAANDERQTMLQTWMAGDGIGTVACHEPDGCYALQHVRTNAIKQGEQWILNGTKGGVQVGAQADHLIVSARTASSHDDADGISLFVVPAATSGVRMRDYPNIDGGRAAELTLENVALPASALIGEAGKGHAILEHAVARGVLALCAEAVGAMDVVKRMTLEYLQTRKQFGVPIGGFQALQHRMADMALEVEQARSAVINAAAALDKDRDVCEKAISAAKYTIGRVGSLVAEEAIQLHGGIGMTWELPLAHYAKRLVMIDHQFGDEDYHLERYIALS